MTIANIKKHCLKPVWQLHIFKVLDCISHPSDRVFHTGNQNEESKVII